MCLIMYGIVDAKNNIAQVSKMTLGCPELILGQINSVTEDSVVVMDYSKYLSLRNTRLPGRSTIVLFDGNPDHLHGSIAVTSNVEDIISIAKTKRVVIFGDGEEIYRKFMYRAQMTAIYRAKLSAKIDSKETFPIIPADDWGMKQRTSHGVDEKNKYPVTFEMWVRKQPIQKLEALQQGEK